MNIEQLPELLEKVDNVEDQLHEEITNSIKSRGVTFTVSAYTTALSRVIGQLIALSKDEDLRKATHEAVHGIIGVSMDNANAEHFANEAIRKASKP